MKKERIEYGKAVKEDAVGRRHSPKAIHRFIVREDGIYIVACDPSLVALPSTRYTAADLNCARCLATQGETK